MVGVGPGAAVAKEIYKHQSLQLKKNWKIIMNQKTNFSTYHNILMKIKNTVQSEKFMRLCAGCFFFGVGACTFAFVSIGVFVLFITPRPDSCGCVNLDAIKTSMSLPGNVSIISQSPVDNTCEVVLETDQNRLTYYVSKKYVIEGQMILRPGWNNSDEQEKIIKAARKELAKTDNGSPGFNPASVN